MHPEETIRVRHALADTLNKNKADIHILFEKDKKFNTEVQLDGSEVMHVTIVPATMRPAMLAIHSKMIEIIFSKVTKSSYDRAESICHLLYQSKGIDPKTITSNYYTESMLYIYELIRLYHPEYLRELVLLLIPESQQYNKFEIMISLAQKAFKED